LWNSFVCCVVAHTLYANFGILQAREDEKEEKPSIAIALNADVFQWQQKSAGQ
jgi:hypothetical protein